MNAPCAGEKSEDRCLLLVEFLALITMMLMITDTTDIYSPYFLEFSFFCILSLKIIVFLPKGLMGDLKNRKKYFPNFLHKNKKKGKCVWEIDKKLEM